MKNVSKTARRVRQSSHLVGHRPIERLEGRVLLSAASTATIPGISVLPSAAPGSVDLNSFFTDNAVAAGDTLVLVQTTNGNIPLELFNTVTPNTTTNFLKYVNGGLYNGVIFHRSVPAFVDQGGGFKPDGTAITSFGTVNNEFHFSNTLGTIAMAKVQNDPNSATNQWFINVANNASILDGENGGFTVFGKVLYNGMTVATAINNLPTIDGSSVNGNFSQLPVQSSSAGAIPSNMVVMNTVSTVSPVSFSVTSDNPGLVTPTLNPDGHTLSLAYTPNLTGVAHIKVTATDLGGGTISQTFSANVGSFVAGAGGNKAVVIQQGNGTQVTVSVHGPGSASLSVSGTNLQQNTARKGILVLSGTDLAVANITTTGTTSASTINIQTKGGTRLATIGAINTDAAIGTLNGKAVDLSGNLAAGGSIKNLMLHSASNGTITIASGATPATIKLSSAATNESLNSASPINNLQVPSWDGGSNTTSSITAPSIGVFNVKGDLANTTVTLNGAGTELKNLNVRGAMTNVLLNASGNLGVITTGSMSGSHVFAGVGTLPAGQPLPNFTTDFVANDSIKTVHVKNTFSNSNIAAESNGNLSLGKIQTTHGGQTFGVAGHTISAVVGTDTTTNKKISLKKLAATTDSTSFEDFAVKVF